MTEETEPVSMSIPGDLSVTGVTAVPFLPCDIACLIGVGNPKAETSLHEHTGAPDPPGAPCVRDMVGICRVGQWRLDCIGYLLDSPLAI